MKALNKHSLKAALAAGTAAMALFAGAATAAGDDSLVATVFGGPSGKVYEQYVYGPFAKERDIRIQTVPLGPTLGLARMQAEKENPTISVYQFAGSQELVAKERGLAAKIGDFSDLGLNPAYYDKDGEWVAVAASPIGLIYNKEKVAAPTSWSDLLKPEYQGHVAFPAMTNAYGPLVLLILAQAQGGGLENIDPGFAALRQLAANKAPIIEQLAEIRQLFEQGDIWIIPYDSALAQRLANSGLPLGFAFPKEGVPLQLITHSVAKNSKSLPTAQAAVRAALDPKAQAELARQLLWYPVNPATEIPQELSDSMLPADALAKHLTFVSQQERKAIVEHLPEWVERFKREVVR